MDESLKKELKQIEKRKQKAREKNDIREEANLCNFAGELLAQHRLFNLAIEEHNNELCLSESLNEPIAVAIAHRKLGECLCECEDFKQAIVHQKQYLKLSMKCKNLVEEQRALATIGRTYFQSAMSSDGSEMVKAQSAFLKSLSVCDKLRDIVSEKEVLEMRARLYLNLGLVYNNLKDQNKGMRFIEKALAITRSQDLKDTEYRCYFSLGEIKLAENRPAEALQCFERARKVAQHQKKKFDEADTLVQMGQVLLRLGDFKAAKNILKKCYKTMKHGNLVDELRLSLIESIKGTRLLEKLENSNEDGSRIKTCEDLGDLYSSIKSYSEAVRYYLKQFELSKKLGKSKQEKAVICVSIAASYSDDKQYEKAKEYFHKELRLREGELEEQCDTWCNIAEVSELAGDDLEVVEDAYKNALACATRNKSEKRMVNLKKLLESLRKKRYEMDEGISSQESKTKQEPSQEVEEECSKEEVDEQEGDRLIQEEMDFSDSDFDDEEQDGAARVKRTSKSINKRNEKGETLLHVAAINGDYNLAKTSIEKGVSIHSRDYCGWQPLHEACNHGNLKIVELLLDKGADINDAGGPHCRGMTPLHDAAQNGHVDVVKLLIARKASVSQRNKDGDRPLDLVLRSIDDDDDDDGDIDPEVAQIREEMEKILRNATTAMKPRPTLELRRRDKLELSDESDGESCIPSTSAEKLRQIFRKTEKSRKREYASLENPAKVAKVTNGAWLDSEGEVRMSEEPDRRELMDDFENSESSLDNTGEQGVLSGNSHNNETLGVKREVIEVDSETQSDYSEGDNIPLIQRCIKQAEKNPPTNHKKPKNVNFSENVTTFARTSDITADPLTGATQEESQDIPALIPEDEYLETAAANDWLIDDMPAEKSGKRKRSGNIRSMLQRSSDFPRTFSNSERRAVPQASSQRSRAIHTSLSKTRQRQSRLSDHVVSGRSSPNTSPGTPPPAVERRVFSSGVSPMRLRVKVQERIFLIPCPSLSGEEKKTVQWLAEQATIRYYSASGLKPILSLSTAEGASLDPHDYIIDVLSNNEEVIASVENWDLPPVHQRYSEACISANTEAHEKILNALQSNPEIGNVEFRDIGLKPATLFPLFRALQYHDQFARLALPGNRMGDEGLRHLISSLPYLSNLVILNLSGNGITRVGVKNLADSLTENDKISKVWSNLKNLDISFNAISDIGAPSLAVMLRSCPDLQILNIQACGLRKNAFHRSGTVIQALQGLRRLRNLNVSHNQIEGEGVRSLLMTVPCNAVEILNLSSTVTSHDTVLRNSLIQYLSEDGCCLKELSCSRCFLGDSEIKLLLATECIQTSLCRLDLSLNDFGNKGALGLTKSIHTSIHLKHVNISGNVQVTNDSLPQLITILSELQYLDLSSCGFTSPLPAGLVMKSSEVGFINLSHNSLGEPDLEYLRRVLGAQYNIHQ